VSRQSSISRALCVFCPQDTGRRISRRSFVIAATPEHIEGTRTMANKFTVCCAPRRRRSTARSLIAKRWRTGC